MSQKRTRLSTLEFLQAIKNDNNKTLEDVANNTGLKLESVYQRYLKLRKKIPQIRNLKRTAKISKTLSNEQLQELWKSL